MVPSAAMMPETWVPWPDPRSVFWYGPTSLGTAMVLLASTCPLTYSGLTTLTLWTTWSARSGWEASQPESTTATVTPLPVIPAARVAAPPMASEEAVSRYWSWSFG